MELLFQHVSYDYPNGQRGLNNVSFGIGAQVVLLAGSNGSGKTTLLKHLDGLLRPTSGSVVVGGINTRTSDPAALSHFVALCFQNPDDQIFCRSVYDEVAVGPINLKRINVAELVNSALGLVGLLDSRTEHPYDLHPSRRRWLGIASALAMDTPCLAFDEPTAGMDRTEKLRFQSVVDYLRSHGKTILISSHDIDFCLEICNRVLLLANGSIVLDATPLQFVSAADMRRLTRTAGINPPTAPRIAKIIGLPHLCRVTDILNSLFSSDQG